MADGFFEEQKAQSAIKAEIVHKYFFAWANVLKNTVKSRGSNIAYIDLFAGPGRYKDGSASVPLLVLERAVQDEFLRKHLATIFNDKDDKNVASLQTEISKISGIDTLKISPQIVHGEVGDEIASQFESMKLVPTFFFVDPWGYKGLSLRLINSVLKDWGCDCVFFFNYNRVNMGIDNDIVEKHMTALFGEEKYKELRKACKNKSAPSRELIIIEKLTDSLQDMGGNYVVPFNFKNNKGTRTSHYLVFVTKHVRGYEIMKEVMWYYSSEKPDGIGSFSYCPAIDETPLLLEFARPLSELKSMLCKEFSGRTLRTIDVFNEHHVGRPFIKRNYKSALLELETEGLIQTDPAKRRVGTLADHVQCTFGKHDG